MPKVSVIIPVYNAEKYIERCARSLFEQTLDDIEYVFVNDCTPDRSMTVLNEVLRDYPTRQSQVRIITHLCNTGQSGARRDGINAVTGDYIIHCDADDWVELDMYERMYNMAVEMSAESVCCDMVLEYKDYNKCLMYNNEYFDHQLMYDCITPISVEYFSLCNRLISKKIYDEYRVLPFEGVNMWEDVGMSIRYRYYIQKNVVINEPFYHYNRQNSDSTSRKPALELVYGQIECAKEIERFFEKHNAINEYSRFISLVKLEAKSYLLDYDLQLWMSTFPETRRSLHIFKIQCNSRRLLKMYLIAYGKQWVINILRLIS